MAIEVDTTERIAMAAATEVAAIAVASDQFPVRRLLPQLKHRLLRPLRPQLSKLHQLIERVQAILVCTLFLCEVFIAET